MADLKISQFVDGGAVQDTDEIASVRSGINTKVVVGSAAALDVGTAIGDVVQFANDGSGGPAYPAADGSNIFNITLPTITADVVTYDPTGGSITATNVQAAIEEIESQLTDKLENITGFITSGSNINITGSGTAGNPYEISASFTNPDAEDVVYDNSISGLAATDVQGAIDEIVSETPIITPWVAYNPTFNGFGTPSNIEFFSRRVGSSLEVRGRFTSGTPTASEARVSIGYNGTNNNVTSSSSVLPANPSVAGPAVSSYGPSSTYFNIFTLIERSAQYVTFGSQASSRTSIDKVAASNMSSSGTNISIFANIPINGW